MTLIRRFCFSYAIAAMSAWVQPWAQGGSAVITLVMPPPGGDGYSALQSGAAFADGAAALYYNPALLPELERSTGSQLFYTQSSQQLFPGLVSGVRQDFLGVAVVLPNRDGYDMGIGFIRNAIDFGYVVRTDSIGLTGDSVSSREAVYGIGLGVRLGCPVTIGVTAKYIDSRLFPMGNEGSAQSWAFDVGAGAAHRFTPPVDWKVPYLEISPSLSLAVRNLGPDVSYHIAYDPIPRTFSIAAGVRADIFDIAEVQAGWDRDDEITRRTQKDAPVYNHGFSILLLAYRYSEGWLEDDVGKRNERHYSHALDVNLLRCSRVVQRLIHKDVLSPSQAMERGYPFPHFSLLGIALRANPRFILGMRRIESHDAGVRGGQRAVFMSFSL